MIENINKLALGTVQFGMKYGINNTEGKPSRESSLSMLDFAWKKGIRIFDTAYNYGEAENVLGEFINSRNISSEVKIITKLKPNILSESTESVEEAISKNLGESLKRLRRDYVDGYLLHTPVYIREPKVVAAMNKLKKDGLIKNMGVSIYEVDDAIYAAGLPEVDYIQIPYSILDQRLDNKDFWNLTKKNKIEVFARSAFLQGLFFMPEDKIPLNFPHLEEVKVYFREIDKVIERYHFTRQQATILFSYCNRHIDHVVFGVDNIKQLAEDIRVVEDCSGCDGCISELRNKFQNIEKSIIFPSLWKK